MNEDLKEIIIYEIRENRKEISKLNKKLDGEIGKIYERLEAMDKHIFSNKMKLSFFIACLTIGFNVIAKIYWPK